MNIKTKLLKPLEELVIKFKHSLIFRSLKFRFLFWNVLISFISVIILLIVFFITVRYTLYSQFDSNLLYNAHEISLVLDNSKNPYSSSILHFNNKNLIGYFNIILNKNGSVIEESNRIHLNNSASLEILNSIKTNPDMSVFTENISGTYIRMTYMPILHNGSIDGVLIVGNSIELIKEALNELLVLMIFISIFFLFISFIVIFYFVHKLMDPLEEITSQIISITGFDLKQRLYTSDLNDEFKILADEFNKLFDRLEHTFERERVFINDVAHEIKTPLAIINGESELSLSKNLTIDEYKKVISINLKESLHIESVLNDILSIARLEYVNRNIKNEKFGLKEVCLDIAEDVKAISQSKSIDFQFISKGTHFYVFGNQENIKKAISNICMNSLKYTSKGYIKLNLFRKAKNIYIIIEDSGIGIAKEDILNIFNRFYRGGNVRNEKGTGIGLSFAQSVIESSGGTIDVQSTKNKGSIFTIKLPEFK